MASHAWRVDVGRIEQGDSLIERRVNGLQCLFAEVHHAAVAQWHAPQAHRGHREVADSTLLHHAATVGTRVDTNDAFSTIPR